MTINENKESKNKIINIKNTVSENQSPGNIRIERDMKITNMNVHIVSVFSVQTTLQDTMIKILTHRKKKRQKTVHESVNASIAERYDSE